MSTVTGNWVLPNGSPVANGIVYFSLNANAAITGTGGQVAPRLVSFPLDASGNLNAVVQGNDTMLPVGTAYTVVVNQQYGGKIWGPETVTITGAAFNMNAFVPS